LSIN